MKTLILCSVALLLVTLAQSADAQAVKWHPGHYVMLGMNSQSQHFKQLDEIGKDSAIKGVQVRMWWGELETSKGVYDFSKVDAYLKKLESLPVPKRLVLRLMDRRFNTSNQAGILPAYLLNESAYHGGLVRSRSGYVARLWDAPVMDRLIALYKALGNRYDDDSYFEGISTEETTLSLRSPYPSGYSDRGLAQQYERLVAAAKVSLPRTNMFLYTNWLGSADVMSDLVQGLMQPQGAAGSSNVIPSGMTLGQKVWSGVYGADYRGTLPLATSVEHAELGGSNGNFTPKQINDFAYSTLQVNYVFWVRNTWSGNSSQRWSTGILPFLRTNPPIRTACPSAYGLCAK